MSTTIAPKLPRCGLALASLILGIASYFTCGLTVLPAVLCGILALNKIKSANGTLAGRGQAIAGLILGGAAIFVLAIGGILAAIAIPAFVNAHNKAQAKMCTENVHQLGVACFLYAAEHNNTLPAKMEDLDPYLSPKRPLICPCAAGSATTTYKLLLPGRKLSELKNPSEAPMIICDTGEHQRQGYIYVCADGHVVISPTPPAAAR
jgi:Tfp pilus assembly protein PilE